MNMPSQAQTNKLGQLRQALVFSGCQFELDQAGDEQDKYLHQVDREIKEFVNEYNKRFGVAPDPFDLLESDETSGVAFFQAIASSQLSIDLRIMIWRVISGVEIQSVEFQFESRDKTTLRVTLTPTSSDGPPEIYESHDPWDYQLLNHFAMSTLNGKPLLTGFYPLSREESEPKDSAVAQH